MDLKKTKILLNKINRLHQGFLDGNETVSQIEKNLMLDYLTKMYDAVVMSDLEAPVKTKAAPVKQPVQQPVAPTPPPVQPVQPVVQRPVVQQPTPKPVVQPTPPPVEKPKPVTQPVVQRVEPVRPVAKPKEPVKTPTPSPVVIKAKKSKFNKDYEELFTFESGGELSDKLANKSIKSIKKAMGINEKYLISNELFGGDNDSFTNTIDQLDDLKSFDEARTLLEQDVIKKFGWDEPKKLKRAKNFLKLVRSRYNS